MVYIIAKYTVEMITIYRYHNGSDAHHEEKYENENPGPTFHFDLSELQNMKKHCPQKTMPDQRFGFEISAIEALKKSAFLWIQGTSAFFIKISGNIVRYNKALMTA